MSAIHYQIMDLVERKLQKVLIDDIEPLDPTRVGVVKQGDLQGDPIDPDEARIYVQIYENDPDKFVTGAVTGMRDEWADRVLFTEIGGATTWIRRFTIKARCLLVDTQEDLMDGREIASTVRSRIEHALPEIAFTSVDPDQDEYVARRIVSNRLRSEMFQAGGPPDSYDFHIKVRFDLLTTAKENR